LPGFNQPPPNSLADRLWRDLGNRRAPDTDWVRFYTEALTDGHADNRALYAYLKVYSPASVKLVPETALKPFYADPARRSYVNPNGTGGTPGQDPDWVDVLAVHDTWGVPLDYMLYVKCEYRLPPGGTTPQWVVTDRKAVLHSRGIDREVYDAWVQSAPNDVTARERSLSPPDKWLFNEDLPRPWADVDQAGQFQSTAPRGFGWVRAVGLNEDYAYRPDGDAVEP
jgi:hypothetical protein